MSHTILAIYENGVFRPLSPLNLREHEQVTLEVHAGPKADRNASEVADDPLGGIRAATGIRDLAENFDDYRFGNRAQP